MWRVAQQPEVRAVKYDHSVMWICLRSNEERIADFCEQEKMVAANMLLGALTAGILISVTTASVEVMYHSAPDSFTYRQKESLIMKCDQVDLK